MKRNLLTSLLLLSLTASAQQTTYTPELLWKLGRLGEMQVSPDRKTVAYTVTRYSLADNKGQADIWTVPVAGGTPKQLTNTSNASENSLNRLPDGRLAFLSDESGTDRMMVMYANGTGKQPLRNTFSEDEDFSNLKFAPKGNFILYTQEVKTGQTVQDLFPDLPKADARLIDDLNYRHWNVWNDYKAHRLRQA